MIRMAIEDLTRLATELEKLGTASAREEAAEVRAEIDYLRRVTAPAVARPGQRVRVTGERGGRTIADEWTVESVGRHAMILSRVRDGKRGSLPLSGTGTLSWSRGPRFVMIRQHCYVEVLGG
jgi:hypothetical protein